ncbi:phage shock protein PspA [Lichenicoccus roseus]|uniref:Phage shock protein PspA n=1 Tax=Lichenicoccus roseus TaxID=2683649 RepID=A0A5R9J2T3_9PROT|nr:phage shock protein PspA [Lichenicoccus roseus]TLU71862.1 phage shock protein PspA [Lichenicoccus roseus]
MSIFSRLTDIVNSNLNALVANAEDPRKIIRLIIQEMEDTLVEVRSSAVQTIAERREIERRLDMLARDEAEWQRKAELALSRDREDLARGALQARAHVAKTRETLDLQRQQIAAGLAQQNEDIAKLQAKLADAKSREQALVSRHGLASSRVKLRETLYDERIGDAFSRFEQVERNLDVLEGRVESYDLGRRSLEDELAGLETDEKVESELDALRARLQRRASPPAGS